MKPLKTILLLAITAASTVTAAVILEHQLNSLRNDVTFDTSPPERTGPLGGMADIVAEASPAVVSIRATAETESMPMVFRNLPPGWIPFSYEQGDAPPEREGMGSGVLLTDEGFIVTNDHVVRDATDIRVQVPGHKASYRAEVVGRDQPTDLALLKIEAEDLKTAVVGDSHKLRPGDTVMAIGNPFGLSETVTSGIVSAIGRKNLDIAAYSDFIQTDASINPGNSGGALIDNKGRLVGINTAIFSKSGGNNGIGFAIPANMMLDIVDRLRRDGEVRRGYLGVVLGDLTPALARGFGIDPEGVLVNEVQPGTPAAQAGLKSGDVILRYDGAKVADMASLRLDVANTEPGTEVPMEVLRSGDQKLLDVEIGELPVRGFAKNRSPSVERPESPLLAGVRFGELGKMQRLRMGMSADDGGVTLLHVDSSSPAYRAGLRVGQVILKLGEEPVENLQEFADHIKALENSEVLVFHVQTPEGRRFFAIDRGEHS